MTAPEDLPLAVCASLSALAEHVALLPPHAFCEPVPDLAAASPAGASIGQHVRHCLEHYETLARGLVSGRCDYDDRARLAEIECDRDRAMAWARELLAELRARLDGLDATREIAVRTASSNHGEVAWQRSSVGREMQFVVSHTVHHAAMIAASCRARGLPIVAEHGVAPSTLRHRQPGI